jgi:Obg family GTPase CgtA
MFDLVQLQLSAGNGGNGRVSFRREKYISKGGPDGGNGGNGGNIYLKATRKVNTLQHFAGVKEYSAKSGEAGGKQNMEGHGGEDLVLEVPIGTRIWLTAENTASRMRRTYHPREGQAEHHVNHRMFHLSVTGGRVEELPPDEIKPIRIGEADEESEVITPTSAETDNHLTRSESLKNVRFQDIPKLFLVELLEEDQTILIVKGGSGGRGNDTFKGSSNTTPIEAEYGTPGEKKAVLLELRLLADVGLVGFPNAGKSTFLSIVTRANPKIANYPFTTLEPNLGVMFSEEAGGRDLVLADIPGLIEGASTGKGLGYEFLRHVHACKVLQYVLTLEENVIYDVELLDEQKAELLWQQYQVLVNELEQYDQTLLDKPSIVSLSKADIYSPELIEAIVKCFRDHDLEILPFSGITRNGVPLMQHVLRAHLDV